MIEGQGSLLHPGYAAVSLGLLHGSQPDAIVVCHRAGMELLDGLDVDVEIPPLNEVAETALALAQITNPDCVWAGISLDSSAMTAEQRSGYLADIAGKYGVPCVDPVATGMADVADFLLEKSAMSREVSVHLENWMALIPFRISRNTWHDFPCVVCEIAEGDKIGRGEALGVYYLDEDQESMLAQIEAVAEPLANGAGRQDLLELLPPGGARCAIDAALWDLEAQLSGTSAWEAAGFSPSPVETVFTIGLEAEPEDMGARAAAANSLSLFKVKLNNDRPVERIAAIRAARPDARLVVDVNEGWEFEQLVASCAGTCRTWCQHDRTTATPRSRRTTRRLRLTAATVRRRVHSTCR